MTLITGGARSGKSRLAVEVAAGHGENRVFVATARVTDPEMKSRIEAHRAERGPAWETYEEPLRPGALLGSLKSETDVAVVDCITLLISNLMIETTYTDAEIMTAVEDLVAAARECRFPVIMVSNEAGMGIVPVEPAARRFRDLTGLANQKLAQAADDVFWVMAGIPLCLKGGERRL